MLMAKSSHSSIKCDGFPILSTSTSRHRLSAKTQRPKKNDQRITSRKNTKNLPTVKLKQKISKKQRCSKPAIKKYPCWQQLLKTRRVGLSGNNFQQGFQKQPRVPRMSRRRHVARQNPAETQAKRKSDKNTQRRNTNQKKKKTLQTPNLRNKKNMVSVKPGHIEDLQDFVHPTCGWSWDWVIPTKVAFKGFRPVRPTCFQNRLLLGRAETLRQKHRSLRLL